MKQLTTELSQNFIEYAAAVNSDRAIPDAKSGLKPVAKRILYGAYSTGKTSNKPRVKCAYIVGDVLARLHPHGDTSVYDAMVRLSQEWIMRYPLIDFYGNKGNIGGDTAAAYRYTEARLNKLAEEGLLNGIKKNCVPFMPTYDDKNEEPVTLPSIFPNLLCNPNAGIGVAIACSWLPHNLIEVANSIYDYMDGKEPIIPGPDFPTGGIVINKNDIPNILNTGHGSVKVRGKYKIEENSIVFYEIPYGTTVENILTQIGDLCEKEEIKGIIEIRDESNKNGLRIVIECNGSIPYIVNQLFKKTSLQSSISYNQVALINKTPTELNYKDCIKIYVDHNIECIINESKFDLEKALARQEIVNGLLKALEDIDNIIQLIKKSKSAAIAREELQLKYGFTENQSKAIVDMKLGKLAGLETLELQNEKADLDTKIKFLNSLINNKDIQYKELKNRLKTIVDAFGDERRTELTQLDLSKDKEIEDVAPERCVVVMTKDGTIKRIPITSYKTQNRKGKGIKNQGTIVTHTIRTNTIDSLMIFSDKGKIYRLLVDKIPEGTNTSKGTSIKNLVTMSTNENPTIIYSIYKGSDNNYVLFATKNGLIKKTPLEEYLKTQKSGLAAIKLKEDDEIVAVTLFKNEEFIILTEQGFSIRIKGESIPTSTRNTMGCRGINLKKEDKIVALLPIRNNTDDVGIFYKSGKGKRVKIDEFTVQLKGGKGVLCGKNDIVVGGILLNDEDNVLINGATKSICIKALDIPQGSRVGSGNLLLQENIITSVSKL